MSRIRTTESRPYDAYFDANYISNTAGMDRRVASSVSRTDTVAGTSRYKYFRRPVMPRMSAVPPQILLAPTEAVDPLVPCEEEPEPTVKDMEIQTMYRESEAQTNPYTPDFFVAPGAAPEVLLLKDLNLGDNQGGLGMKQVEMIENARRKRDVESNLPPFTDEAGLRLRKRLMEIQEMKEFRMREGEIDTRREARMEAIEQALRDRDESAEFLASQRVEGLRLLLASLCRAVRVRVNPLHTFATAAIESAICSPQPSTGGSGGALPAAAACTRIVSSMCTR